MSKKQTTFKITSVFAVVLIIAGVLTQSCSKKSDPGPGGENPGPGETETLKLIPDSMFRVYLKANVCPNAFDVTGKYIDITHPEVKNFTGTMKIDTVNIPSPFVASLRGIEYFSKMTKLIVDKAPVDSLVLNKTMNLDTVKLLNTKDLQYVKLAGCTNMRYIRAAGIPVLSLDLSNLPELNYVNLISLTRLSSLKVDNDNKLRHLMTFGLTSLNSVNTSTNPELGRLFLEYATKINSIDVTKNRKLYHLVASFCVGLNSIDLSKNDSLVSVLLDDSNIDTIDVSHNPELLSLQMLRTPLRNVDFRTNPKLRLLYLDGCTQLKTADLRAQTSWDYYMPDRSNWNGISQDDRYQIFQDPWISAVQTSFYSIFGQATRKGINGATTDLYGGLRVPQYLDANALSLTEVKMNDATKDNYSLVMARRTLGTPPAVIKVYAADQSTVLCNDYDPLTFTCK